MPDPQDSATSPFRLAVLTGYGLLAFALVDNWGFFSSAALAAVVGALGAWTGALVSAGRRSVWDLSHAALALGGFIALAFVVAGLLVPPGLYLDPELSRRPLQILLAGAGVILLFVLAELLDWRRPARRYERALRIGALVVLAGAAGAWMLQASPRPAIDVWEVHQQGAEALLEGRSPYGALEFRSTYRGDWITSYPYPPASLLLTTSAFAVAGDTRWAQLACLLVSGVLLAVLAARGRPHRPWPEVLVALLLFHPRNLFILEQAWGEPLALPFMVSFALLSGLRKQRLSAAVALGLLASIKQQLLLFLAFAALRAALGVRLALVATIVVVATLLPFVVLDPGALWRDLVVHHLNNPFRPESLSLPAAAVRLGFAPWPSWIGFAAAAVGFALTTRWAKSPAVVLLGAALTFGLFFVFGRQAFAGYYYLVGTTALVAVAADLSVAPGRRKNSIAR